MDTLRVWTVIKLIVSVNTFTEVVEGKLRELFIFNSAEQGIYETQTKTV